MMFFSLKNTLKPNLTHRLEINKGIKCKFCNKEFSHRQSRWKHEQECQMKNNTETKLKMYL